MNLSEFLVVMMWVGLLWTALLQFQEDSWMRWGLGVGIMMSYLFSDAAFWASTG